MERGSFPERWGRRRRCGALSDVTADGCAEPSAFNPDNPMTTREAEGGSDELDNTYVK